MITIAFWILDAALLAAAGLLIRQLERKHKRQMLINRVLGASR